MMDTNSGEFQIMNRLSPIQGKSLYMQVYKELMGAILSGRIAPGESLTLEGISAELKVSLTPVREALRRLEADNFICLGPNSRRITVKELSPKNLREIYEVRLLLECFAAEKACMLRDEAVLDPLVVLIHEQKYYKDSEDYLTKNKEFHFIIYRESKISILVDTINMFWRAVSPYFHIHWQLLTDSILDSTLQNHKKMVEALRNRDSKAMNEWLRKDLTDAADIVIEVLENNERTKG
jgi:DNA-binding GntR family transcriptional regulator